MAAGGDSGRRSDRTGQRNRAGVVYTGRQPVKRRKSILARNSKSTTAGGFTLIEFLIALVIIGFIVAILVGVFSSPLKQAKTDSAISQVKDGLRQVSEAINLSALQGKATCCYSDDLVTDGFISARPAIPAGIAADPNSPPDWGISTDPSQRMGGCGTNSGDPITVSARIVGVSDEFCAAYNLAQGLAGEAVKCCQSNPAGCSGGATDGGAPVTTSAVSFCFTDSDGPVNVIYYNTGVDGAAHIGGGGVSSCP